MPWINDTPNSPLRFVAESGEVIGQFYNSRDKMYHLARYVPYDMPPSVYLCGRHGNFSPSRWDGKRMKCAHCWRIVAEIEAED